MRRWGRSDDARFLAAAAGACAMMLELMRFSHTIFAMPFAVLGADHGARVPLAERHRSCCGSRMLLGVLVCMVFARSAAMAFNRVGRPRLRRRAIPAPRTVICRRGCCRRGEAMGLTVVCARRVRRWHVCCFGRTGCHWPRRCRCLAFCSDTVWPNVLLWPPICGWASPSAWLRSASGSAVRGAEVLASPAEIMPRGHVGRSPWRCGLTGFDIIYACQDEEFDRGPVYTACRHVGECVAALRIAAVCSRCDAWCACCTAATSRRYSD